jgi:hypothetical protein
MFNTKKPITHDQQEIKEAKASLQKHSHQGSIIQKTNPQMLPL